MALGFGREILEGVSNLGIVLRVHQIYQLKRRTSTFGTRRLHWRRTRLRPSLRHMHGRLRSYDSAMVLVHVVLDHLFDGGVSFVGFEHSF